MCIRDSQDCDTERGEVAEDHRCDQQDRRNDRSQQQHEDHDCLLYTSDAADERSSVDLGGRRIIKKKKHKV